MIELFQLEQLIAFAKYGTLSKAAEELHLSQPSLTRAMQKLEDEFRVTLFHHKKNKLSLNENGKLAVDYAKKVLESKDDMINKVRMFDRSQHTVSLGSSAPAPLWDISPLLSNLYPQMTISTELKDTDILIQGLHDNTYQLIILPKKLDDNDCECIQCGKESLYLTLPKTHRLANSEGIFLKDLDGENMLLYSEIGFWHELHKTKMPHSKFLVQNERFAFNELVNSSILPSFTSDLVLQHPEQHNAPSTRNIIPILDEEAHVRYYCCFLKKNNNQFKSFIRVIEQL